MVASTQKAQSLADTSITKKDVETFLSQSSDFGFEMKVKRIFTLVSGCPNVSHAGTYRDPVTDKSRQFDLRGDFTYSSITVRLAIECKNIRAASPLLIHATLRTEQEAVHDVIERTFWHMHVSPHLRRHSSSTLYPAGEFVGRGTDQIMRDKNGLKSDDEKTYDKMSQAVNSTRDLTLGAMSLVTQEHWQLVIVPMLVIPDDRLWQVDYRDDGTPTGSPRLVPRSTVLQSTKWTIKYGGSELDYMISHLEVVTISALQQRIKDFELAKN